jgi:hypothetical protein
LTIHFEDRVTDYIRPVAATQKYSQARDTPAR